MIMSACIVLVYIKRDDAPPDKSANLYKHIRMNTSFVKNIKCLGIKLKRTPWMYCDLFLLLHYIYIYIYIFV